MNYKAKFISAIITFLMFSSIVFAEGRITRDFLVTTDGTDVSVEETEIQNNADSSNVPVTVVRQIGGQTAIIYEGLLGGYDNGSFSSIDFSGIDSMIIADWDSHEVIYIIPVEEEKTLYNSLNTASDENTQNNRNVPQNPEAVLIESQIKLNGVNVGEEGLRVIDNADMQCDFSVSNTSANSEKATVVLATYSSAGALVNLETFSVDIAGNSMENISFVYRFNAETEHGAKLLFWNSLVGMMPIRATIDFSQNSGINAYYYNQDNRLLQIDKANGTSIFYTYDNMGSLLTKTIRR